MEPHSCIYLLFTGSSWATISRYLIPMQKSYGDYTWNILVIITCFRAKTGSETGTCIYDHGTIYQRWHTCPYCIYDHGTIDQRLHNALTVYMTMALLIRGYIMPLLYIWPSQWGISNKLNHFRFARIAIHFLQCRRLQAEDNEIVNIELTR